MPTIRLATEDDRAAVARLMNEYSSETVASESSTPADQIILAENNPTEAIGFVSLGVAALGSSGANVREVIALYVVPTHRRRKIAMLLLAEAERVSRDQGVAELKIGSSAVNQPAQAFFHAMGYAPTDSGFKKQLPPKRSAKSRRAEG